MRKEEGVVPALALSTNLGAVQVSTYDAKVFAGLIVQHLGKGWLPLDFACLFIQPHKMELIVFGIAFFTVALQDALDDLRRFS